MGKQGHSWLLYQKVEKVDTSDIQKQYIKWQWKLPCVIRISSACLLESFCLSHSHSHLSLSLSFSNFASNQNFGSKTLFFPANKIFRRAFPEIPKCISAFPRFSLWGAKKNIQSSKNCRKGTTINQRFIFTRMVNLFDFFFLRLNLFFCKCKLFLLF